MNNDREDQLSVSVKTTPADADPIATTIARRLVSNLQAVGVDAQVVPMSEEELLRDVLINHEFDAYVTQFPARSEPDFLRTTFHSRFNAEPGWQNPMGYANLDLDELLVGQRDQIGKTRRETVAEIQRHLVDHQPMTVLAFPDEIRTARTDRYEGWGRLDPTSPLDYLALDPTDEADGTLRVVVTDTRITQNLNPIAVEFRNDGTFTNLLYDSLARRIRGETVPWLANSWEWDDADVSGVDTDVDRVAATVHIDPDAQWHDGVAVTASDVAFTYRLLEDTWLGEQEDPLPAPRFRARSSLVSSVSVLDETTVRVGFDAGSPAVAERAFTVPILPEHVWEHRASETELGGIGLFESTPEALVTNNVPPVGSGPLAFEEQIPDEALILTRNDDHFLAQDPPAFGDDDVSLGVPFDRFVARVAPSANAAVELVAAGEADATASSLVPSVIPAIGRSTDLQLRVDPSRSFYHVGYNVRRGPFGNPRFRRTVARLLDRDRLRADVFDGYARSAVTPLAGTRWAASDLRWNADDPDLGFIGTDGELAVERAKDAFRQAGFRYREDGALVVPE